MTALESHLRPDARLSSVHKISHPQNTHFTFTSFLTASHGVTHFFQIMKEQSSHTGPRSFTQRSLSPCLSINLCLFNQEGVLWFKVRKAVSEENISAI